MVFILFLLALTPLFIVIFGYPYGSYKAKSIEKLIENEELMDKIKEVIDENLSRVEEGSRIIYKQREKTGLNFEFIRYTSNKWVLKFKAPLHNGFIEISYKDGKIIDIYGDTYRRQRLSEEYFVFFQKRFVEIIKALEEKEMHKFKRINDFDKIENDEKVVNWIKRLKTKTQQEKKIHHCRIGDYTIKNTIDETFVVLKIYHSNKEIYYATCHQEQKEVLSKMKNLGTLREDDKKFFIEKIKPEIEDFMLNVKAETREKMELDKNRELEIEVLLSGETEELKKKEFMEIKKMYHQMDEKKREEVRGLYEEALEKLYNDTKLKQNIKEREE